MERAVEYTLIQEIDMKRDKKKYTLTLENRSKLDTIFRWRTSRTGMILCFILLFFIALTAVSVLIVFSPLGHWLSGRYGNQYQVGVEKSIARIDSLNSTLEAQATYIANLRNVLNPGRNEERDSLTAAMSVVSSDSLISASPREMNFVGKISNRERRAGKLLANDPVMNIAFIPPVTGVVMSEESKGSGVARFSVPVGADIYAVGDGRVVEKYFSARSAGFVVVIQHPKGYISRYSGLGNPVSDIGDWVSAGQAIAMNTTKIPSPCFNLEIWHDGYRLLPEDFIYSRFFSSDNN